MASKQLFCVTNHLDNASTLLTADSAVATLPVTNLLDARPSKLWRSNGATTATISLDFQQGREVKVVGIFGTNLRAGDTVQVKIDGGAVYDSGLVDAKAEDRRRQIVLPLSTAYIGSTVDITLTAINGQLAVEAGRVWVGPVAWQPLTGFIYGSSQSVEDLSAYSVAPKSGARYFATGATLRRYSIDYDFISDEERELILEDIDLLQISQQVLFVPDFSLTQDRINRQALLGYIDSKTPLGWRAADASTKRFELVEAG